MGFVRKAPKSNADHNLLGPNQKGLYIKLEPACSYHIRRGVSSHNRVDYQQGRQMLWKCLRKRLVSEVMDT